MHIPPSSLWQVDLPQDLDERLADLFKAAEKQEQPVQIFFRADDIGRIDNNFIAMMRLFAQYGMPICPALVPEWLTVDNWQQMQQRVEDKKKICWHQHGFNHVNHESAAKKNEFGQSRTTEAIRDDILAGKRRLEKLLTNAFFPVFTPPWNRCSGVAMRILQELNFIALSRSTNVQPSPPPGLPDLTVNIDLHTRRETDPNQAMGNLLAECQAAMQSGCMGFMLHHQRMNATALLFLEHLFQAINASAGVVSCTFRELLVATNGVRSEE